MQDYAVGIFHQFPTKSSLKKAIKKEQILMDGKAAQTGTFLKGGETITLRSIDATPVKKAFTLDLRVIYEDDYLAAIHKPAGILVSGNSFKTIASALPQNLNPSPLTDATQPQPIHRLDYATTGILLCGKTGSAIRALNAAFANKSIRKTYYAVTLGAMEKKGIISAPIDEKPSASHYEVLASIPSERFGCLNLVKLRPETGRRHQLRKHMASIGNPILGDKDYGSKDMILQGKGLYLHAFSVEFHHPFTNEKMRIKSGLPEKFVKLFPSADL